MYLSVAKFIRKFGDFAAYRYTSRGVSYVRQLTAWEALSKRLFAYFAYNLHIFAYNLDLTAVIICITAFLIADYSQSGSSVLHV